MNTKLKRVEIERAFLRHHYFGVEHTACRQLLKDRIDQLGEVAVEWLFVTALNHHFFAVAKDQRAKAVPLRFENPIARGGQLVHTLGEHRQNRRIYWQLHDLCNLFRHRLHRSMPRSYGEKNEPAEVFLGGTLPRALVDPSPRPQSETENSDLRSQIRSRSTTYLARRRALPGLERV